MNVIFYVLFSISLFCALTVGAVILLDIPCSLITQYNHRMLVMKEFGNEGR